MNAYLLYDISLITRIKSISTQHALYIPQSDVLSKVNFWKPHMGSVHLKGWEICEQHLKASQQSNVPTNGVIDVRRLFCVFAPLVPVLLRREMNSFQQ